MRTRMASLTAWTRATMASFARSSASVVAGRTVTAMETECQTATMCVLAAQRSWPTGPARVRRGSRIRTATGSSTVRICVPWTGRRRLRARADAELRTTMRTAIPSPIAEITAPQTRTRLLRSASAGAEWMTQTRTVTALQTAVTSARTTRSGHSRGCAAVMARIARPKTAPRSFRCRTKQRPPFPPPGHSARPPRPPGPSWWAPTPPSPAKSPRPARAPPGPPAGTR
mmetsp:Transcript_50686/g.133596  ORF Transcript_50686/g.133596 Transcript_50686/m.133596 type:complete len:228 (+) Transcript_50686:2559-3242(+)